jgi:segregation and condensation protein B
VGYRDVPGKPAMFGTTKDFLDYFGLKKLEDLPTLAEIRDLPELSPQTDLLESLATDQPLQAESAEIIPLPLRAADDP